MRHRADLVKFLSVPVGAIAIVGAVTWGALARPATSLALIATLAVLVAWVIDVLRGVGPFSPLMPLLLAVLTSLTIPAWLGYFDGPSAFAVSAESNFTAVVCFAVFISLAVLVYLVFSRSAPGLQRVVSVTWTPWQLQRAILAWLTAIIVALMSLANLIGDAGGLNAYAIDLASRTVAFQGKGVFIVLLLAPAAASLVFLATYWSRLNSSGPLFGAGIGLTVSVLPILLSALFLLSTGNRMNLVVYLAAVAYVRHRMLRPLSVRTISAGVAFVAFLGLALPSVLRTDDRLAERDFEPVSVGSVYESLRFDGPIHTFGQVPALGLAVERDLESTDGVTYLAAATMLIPRSIAPWKLPDVGQVVTEAVLPRYWFQAGTGVQVGAPGEAYVNFGWSGPLTVGVLAGLALLGIRRLGLSSDPRLVLVFAVLLPRTALYFRGGFANVTTYLLLDLGLLIAAMVFAGPTLRPLRSATSGLGEKKVAHANPRR